MYTITTDKNATYKEYLIAFADPRKGDPVYITSDDLIEFPKITAIIQKNEDTGKQTLLWTGSAGERKLSKSIWRFIEGMGAGKPRSNPADTNTGLGKLTGTTGEAPQSAPTPPGSDTQPTADTGTQTGAPSDPASLSSIVIRTGE